MGIKSFKGISLKQKSTVEISNGIVLPLRTLSISEETTVKFDKYTKIPKKTKPANSKEINEIKKYDPDFNKKLYPMLVKYDVDSVEYREMKEMENKYEETSRVVKFIDMDYVLDNGNTIWEDLDIEEGNWLEVCKYFGDEMHLTTADYESILIAVKQMQGESVFEKLARIKRLSGKNMLELLEYIEEMEEKELLSQIEKDIEREDIEKAEKQDAEADLNDNQ